MLAVLPAATTVIGLVVPGQISTGQDLLGIGLVITGLSVHHESSSDLSAAEHTRAQGHESRCGHRPAMNSWRRLWARVCEFNATQIELQERLLLLSSPWEEEFVHWRTTGTASRCTATGRLHPMADATA